MKLTKATVAKLTLPAGKAEAFEWDDEIPGFGIKLTKSGPRWVFQYRLGGRKGKQRRLTFGSATAMNVADARERAGQFHAKVKLGQDPAADKFDANAKASNTFGAAVERFIEWQETRKRKNGAVGLKPKSLKETKRYLNVHAKELHELQIDLVDQARVALLISCANKDHGPYAANRLRSALSRFFNWSMRAGVMKLVVNPAAFTQKNEEQKRDRVLAPNELRSVWKALPPAGDDYGDIVRLLMFTLTRREEIGALAWSEIDDNGFELPGDRTKNTLPLFVPLAPAARAILAKRPRLAARDLVFGTGKGGFSGWSHAKAALDEAIAKARKEEGLEPMAPWVHHDLRRTGDTMMNESPPRGLGVAPHIVEAIVNHVSGDKSGKKGVAGVYNRATYLEEKTDALERWAAHLLAIVEPNVIQLRRKRR